MADVYMYAGLTGDLGFTRAEGSSTYFGVGTATYVETHSGPLWEGLRLRWELENPRVRIENGFSAIDDKPPTRRRVYQLIHQQAPRLDATLLVKANAYDRVVSKGPDYVLKWAWLQHIQRIVWDVAEPGDSLHFITASVGTRKQREDLWASLYNVCVEQRPEFLHVKVHQWERGSSWGLQVIDYAMWATSRHEEGLDDTFWPFIQPHITIEKLWRR